MGRYLVKTILDFAHLQERVSTVPYVMTPAARFELCEGGAEYPLVVRGQVGPGGLPEASGGPDESRTKRAPAADPADGRRSRVLRTAFHGRPEDANRLSAHQHGGRGTTAASPIASCTPAQPAASATAPSTPASASRRTPAAPPRGPRSARPPRGSRRRSPRPARWADRGPGGSPSWCPTPRAGRW